MDDLKIDFLRKKYRLDTDGTRPFIFFRRLFVIVSIVIASFGGIFSHQVATSGEARLGSFPRLSLFSTLRELVQTDDKLLKGEEGDRINFLLLGVGGAGHDGPELTDTIIFGSVRPSDTSVGMFSIPRDLTVPVPGYGWRKINSVNALAEKDDPGTGAAETGKVLSNLFGQNIHYYVKVDFDAFQELIDTLGGVDVFVEHSFVDSQYPTEDDLIQTISFKEGWQTMDGKTALIYTRSRHGTNGEGSDFARSRRQQKILLAVKEKTFRLNTWLNPGKINGIFTMLEGHVQTNLSLWEMVRLAKLLRNYDSNNIVNHVLDTSPDSPIYPTSLEGLGFVLLPKNDDWEPLRLLADHVFDSTTWKEDVLAKAPEKQTHFVRVEIQNGTGTKGLASYTAQLLEGQGFEVVKIGNAAEREYSRTVIYDLTDGQRTEELKILQEFLKADISMSASGWMFAKGIVPKEISVSNENTEAKTTEKNVDFLIILGETSTSLVRT